MKVTFISNFLTHHQVQFCKDMAEKLGNDFKFISTQEIFDWRLKLGFEDLDSKYDFVIRAYLNEEEYSKALDLANSSDIVIIGSTTDDLIKQRLKEDKIIFRYRSRIFAFPDGFFKTIFNRKKMKLFKQRHIKYRRNKNLYLLCASAYGPNDFSKFKLYKNKMYTWGYFLETYNYDIDRLIEKKEKNNVIEILWVARFIKWKHPEVVLKLAQSLKKKGLRFKIKMLGTGVLENKIKDKIKKKGLEGVVEVVGQVPSNKVQDYMKNANIFIGTSDKNEGWGAVINEAMNAGCMIIANQKMGSVPLLIKHNENGLIYNSYEDLERYVNVGIQDKNLWKRLGKNAYKTITEEWSSKVATENLLELFDEKLKEMEIAYGNGPARKARKYHKLKI